MEPFEIPNIETDGVSIPNIQINGTNVRIIPYTGVRGIGNNYVQDNRVWLITPPQSVPLAVPVTEIIGTPIVDMPGCVKVHKENAKNPANKNKMLVDNDPKGNVVLCDNGMPYYQPPDYQQNRLTWTTVTPQEPEADGVNSEQPNIPTPEVPGTPKIPSTKEEEKECPGPKDLRVGDYTTSGDEKVIGHKWNSDETVCIT